MKNLSHNIWPIIGIVLGIALQIQISLFQTETYVGLRVNLADLALPFVGLLIATSLLFKKSYWPSWHIKCGYVWFALLSLCFLYAFAIGYWRSGEINQWALVNKLFGWFILMGYLGVGAWLRSNEMDKTIRYFLITFIGFFITTVLLELTGILHKHLTGDLMPGILAYPADGFMANKNTYGFLIICIFIFVFLTKSLVQNKFYNTLITILIALSPLLIFYNGSRAISLLFPLVFLILALTYFDWKRFIAFPLLCLAFMFWLISLNINNNAPYTHTYINLKTTTQESISVIAQDLDSSSTKTETLSTSYDGDNLRLDTLRLGFEMWQEQPIIGNGLGRIQDKQIEEYGKVLTAMDNTVLWILAEFGTPVFIIFACFFICALIALHKNGKHDQTLYGSLSQCAFYMLLIYAAISMFHEITYARFLWVFLGLGLAATVPKNQGEPNSEPSSV